MNNYLETDEYVEAISSLVMFSEQINRIKDDNYRWKWSIIILHNALQAFMVLSLKGTNGFMTMSKKSLEAWNEAYDSNQDTPRRTLDTFTNLFKKIKKYRNFETTNSFEDSIKKLHCFRNSFIHFTPKSWLIETSGLPTICMNCLNIIDFLIHHGEITWYDDEVYKETINALEKAKKGLSSFPLS